MTATDQWLSKDPTTRAGLYQSIDEVPEHHRLRNYASRFEGRDSWEAYVEAEGIRREDHSESYLQGLDRRERRWKGFSDGQGKHHALCTPANAQEYAVHLIDGYSLAEVTAAKYWASVERFYRWMFHHAEYPHLYNPFVIAAIDDSLCKQLWRIAVEPN